MTVKGVYTTCPKAPFDLGRTVAWPRACGTVGQVAAPLALAKWLLLCGCRARTVLGADGAIHCGLFLGARYLPWLAGALAR